MNPIPSELEPLSEAETEVLRKYLRDSGGASLEYARGVFSGVACSPQAIDAPTWLPWVLGSSTPNKAALRESFGLLMREAHSIAECLALGEPWFPAVDQSAAQDQSPDVDTLPVVGSKPADAERATAELVQFCKGFTRVTQHGSEWRKASSVFLKVLPIAATAGYIDATALAVVLPGQLDAQQWLEQERKQLRARVLEIYTQFADTRAQNRAAATAGTRASVGRNEPCPCGSGKKYKKCCAI